MRDIDDTGFHPTVLVLNKAAYISIVAERQTGIWDCSCLPMPDGLSGTTDKWIEPIEMVAETSPHQAPLTELRDRVAFITGGSSGIGLGIARACSEAGMKVAVTYLTEAHIEAARSHYRDAEDRFHAIRVDVRDRTGMQDAAAEAIELFGAVHLICANAGLGITASVSQAAYEDWEDAIGTNVMGVVNTINAFLPCITAKGAAPTHLVATSSMSGLFHAASTGVYTTTKFAVVGMMEALRGEMRPHGVGVSVFCPGLVQSRIFDQYRHRSDVLKGTSDEPAGLRDRRLKAMAAGMDPLECGRKVLRGVRRNDMYILTHPEFRDGLSERFQAVMGAFDACDEPVPQARVIAERVVLRHPIYAEGVGP